MILMYQCHQFVLLRALHLCFLVMIIVRRLCSKSCWKSQRWTGGHAPVYQGFQLQSVSSIIADINGRLVNILNNCNPTLLQCVNLLYAAASVVLDLSARAPTHHSKGLWRRRLESIYHIAFEEGIVLFGCWWLPTQ